MTVTGVTPPVSSGCVATHASVLTLDGRASVIAKDCSIPVNDVTSKVSESISSVVILSNMMRILLIVVAIIIVL